VRQTRLEREKSEKHSTLFTSKKPKRERERERENEKVTFVSVSEASTVNFLRQ
jgi:hypothetical protein